MGYIDDLQQISDSIALRSHFVKEWERSVFFGPLSPHETAIAAALPSKDDPPVYFSVALVCVKALDENGRRMFENADFKRLRNLKFQSAFVELASKFYDSVPTVEEQEKNSEPVTS